MTIPIHDLADKLLITTSNEVDENADTACTPIFNTLKDIVNFTNGITNGIIDQINNILSTEIHPRVKEILIFSQTTMKRDKLFHKMGLSNQSFVRQKYLDPLLTIGWIEKVGSTKNSLYKITDSGNRLLSLFN